MMREERFDSIIVKQMINNSFNIAVEFIQRKSALGNLHARIS